ncbi:MAG: S-layer protein, partial [Candidatus Aenigmatarchaeota archaeon]
MALMAATVPTLAADYTLADFPEPFVEDSSPNFTIVVGKDASVKDVVSGLNVAARLGGETVTTSTGETSVQGGETEEVGLEQALSNEFSATLDDNDIAGLQDKTVSWNSEDVDVEETVSVDNAKVMTSETDEDFGSEVYLGTSTSSGAMTYSLTIDDNDFNKSAV